MRTIASTVEPPPPAAAGPGVRAVAVVAQANRGHLDTLARPLDQGALRVELAGTFPKAEAARAQVESQGGHVRGKLVLTIADRGASRANGENV